MTVKNTIKAFIEKRGITVYRFRKDVGVAQSTAYDLVNNSGRIPNADVLDKICTAYEIQPGEIIEWIPAARRIETKSP
ncbi:helix-turn-helix domain-containing protein [Myxacorys almedinensis]|uniref:Helix-turn-helix domain-containing protein n=1 Tax=Myxacorys almedinensis A TaxID=2690445 RepID=A0A8J7YYH1_9CYAN|nr:helix-turn-helix transcriptional regulator [Myxacorys almedinensis]NDJ16927.1 helix-turn-helix domain-containing protein [Myxacorys almedinensis A]